MTRIFLAALGASLLVVAVWLAFAPEEVAAEPYPHPASLPQPGKEGYRDDQQALLDACAKTIVAPKRAAIVREIRRRRITCHN